MHSCFMYGMSKKLLQLNRLETIDYYYSVQSENITTVDCNSIVQIRQVA